MLSKLLWTIEEGWEALKRNGRFVIVALLVVVMPLSLLYFIDETNQTTVRNTQTSQKETIAILHQALWQQDNLENKLADSILLKELNSPASVWLYEESFEQRPLYASVDSEQPPKAFFELSTVSKTPLIFETRENEARVWYAVSTNEQAGQLYTLVTKHDYSNLDVVISERINRMLGVAAMIVALLLLVTYWMIKQVNWERRYRDLEMNLDEQTTLIATITHEFRAPLTAMQGYLSFLFESNRLRTKDKDSLVRVSLSNERLLKLVNDFLEVSKIQSGKLDLTATRVPITNAVYRAITELGGEAAEKKLVLRDGTKDAKIEIVTDEDRLVQILINLIHNAIKYTDRGSVVVTYEENPLFVTIRVQDTGSGISAEDQKKLFSPFVRVGGKKELGKTGSGLGMWITRKLVELLGGTVGIESIHGVGTHVVVRFDKRKIAAKTRAGIL